MSRKARDGSHYTRVQQGHSVLLHLMLGWIFFYIPSIYFALSPNHYWHL